MSREHETRTSPTAGHAPAVVIAGAAPDTGNLGVSALAFSVLAGVSRRVPDGRAVLLDHGRGIRAERLTGEGPGFRRCGLYMTRRHWRPESLQRVALELAAGARVSAQSRLLHGAECVLDVSGGDSFTDLYGAWRFNSVIAFKRLALRAGVRLVLLPQTYGPFREESSRAIAADLVRSAAAAWARDARSFEVLRSLLGSAFDPSRHCLGVDVAFLLDRLDPGAGAAPELRSWLSEPAPVAGLNVSGLVYNDPAPAHEQYGLRVDYPAAVRALALRILSEADARLLLVPHVAPARSDSVESDAKACRSLLESLPPELRARVRIAPEFADPRHAKWLIAQCDWFCGTRMHSTIAGLSTGVPTGSLAYSGKTQGVFETCEQGRWVADMRSMGTEEAVERIIESWVERSRVRRELGEALPRVLEAAERQMDRIVAQALGDAERPSAICDAPSLEEQTA